MFCGSLVGGQTIDIFSFSLQWLVRRGLVYSLWTALAINRPGSAVQWDGLEWAKGGHGAS